MSIQSDAAKAHIEKLLTEAYPTPRNEDVMFGEDPKLWWAEYAFHPDRKWRFDYAVPHLLCAKLPSFDYTIIFSSRERTIELDGGTGGQVKKIGKDYYVRLSGHNSPDGLRNWREKNNEAMKRGWKVFHFSIEEVIKAGRKGIFLAKQSATAEHCEPLCMEVLRNPAR